jgi:hypothetical protein
MPALLVSANRDPCGRCRGFARAALPPLRTLGGGQRHSFQSQASEERSHHSDQHQQTGSRRWVKSRRSPTCPVSPFAAEPLGAMLQHIPTLRGLIDPAYRPYPLWDDSTTLSRPVALIPQGSRSLAESRRVTSFSPNTPISPPICSNRSCTMRSVEMRYA